VWHKTQELVPHRGVGVQIPPSAPNFLVILAVTKKGGDNRRSLRPICANDVLI